MRAKTLIEHVRDGTFRPRMHTAVLAREELPIRPPHPDPTPAMTRLWARLRSLQSEFRDVASVEVRHDMALEFRRVLTEYLDAVTRTRRDPLVDIDGLAEIIAVNRLARELHQRSG